MVRPGQPIVIPSPSCSPAVTDCGISRATLAMRPEEPRSSSRRRGGRNRRVLLVEDNAEVGAFAERMLDDLGYAATWARSATPPGAGRWPAAGCGFQGC